MDLKQLEYFVRVAELGSFTRASIALDIAQPALSRQIRLLEVELHQSLLTRNGRGALPTEAGNLLLKHGRGILHQVDVAREELGAVRGALAGRVSIGLPPSLSRLITVPLTRAFRQQLPQAHLTLTEGFSVVMYEGPARRQPRHGGALQPRALARSRDDHTAFRRTGADLEKRRCGRRKPRQKAAKNAPRTREPISLAQVAALP